MLVRSGGARPRGDRLGGGARAARRDRGRDGRHARRAAGAADVPGDAEALRLAVKFDTTAIFINQLREKIGVMFGSPETTPGGRALKFYSTIRLDVRKIENLKDGTEVVGSRTRVKVVKNKVAPPFRQCEFDIMYGKGISKEGSLIDVGVDLEIVKKSGAWFTYEGEQLGQGRENARQFLAEHTDIRDEIERKVREAVGLTVFAEDDDQPITIDEAEAPPPEEPPTARTSPSPQRSPGARRPRRRGRRAAGPRAPKNPKRCPRAGARAPGGAPRSRRELERRLLAARFEADEVEDVAHAPGAGRPDRRRGLRAAVRGAAVRVAQGGEPGRRAGAPGWPAWLRRSGGGRSRGGARGRGGAGGRSGPSASLAARRRALPRRRSSGCPLS